MKHTIKKLSDTRVAVTIDVDPDTITQAKAIALKQLSKNVKVQGFRKGKVPSAVVEKSLDPNDLADEAVQYAINNALNSVIDELDLRVLDQPKVELKKFVPYTTLEFTAEVEVLPEIKLGDYKKLKAKKAAAKVDTAEVDEVIERIRQSFADKNEVKRAAKDGDDAVIDFNGTDKDGKDIDGAAGKDYTLRLGSKTFIPGFEDQIIGHKPGDVFDVKVTFPKDYHAEHLKSAKVTFAVTLHKIIEAVLPAVDDELAKKVGPFETVKAMRDDIQRELTAQKEREATDKLKDDLLGELVEKSTVPLPQLLVDDQLRSIEQDAMQNLMYRGQSLEDYLKAASYDDADQWRDKELRPAAERRVQAGLVLSELTKAEKIDITKAELDAELERRKSEAPKIAEQLDTPEARRDVANRVLTEKTINRLVELNS